MVTTAKKLRFHTKELLESVSRGEEVVITMRGKPYAKLVPIKKAKNRSDSSKNYSAFGKIMRKLKT